MANKKRVVVVGPSGSGKSTLVDHLRGPEFEPHIVIPKRVITLPIRGDSNPVENRNVSTETFRSEVDLGLIKPWWKRRFGDGADSTYFYGFERVPKQDPRLRLFLGNNALLGANSGRVHRLMEKSLVVVVRADPDVRGERLDERLPGMDGAERSQRIADGLGLLANFNPLDVVEMDTTGMPVEESAQCFAEIVMTHAGLPAPAAGQAPTRVPSGV